MDVGVYVFFLVFMVAFLIFDFMVVLFFFVFTCFTLYCPKFLIMAIFQTTPIRTFRKKPTGILPVAATAVILMA